MYHLNLALFPCFSAHILEIISSNDTNAINVMMSRVFNFVYPAESFFRVVAFVFVVKKKLVD